MSSDRKAVLCAVILLAAHTTACAKPDPGSSMRRFVNPLQQAALACPSEDDNSIFTENPDLCSGQGMRPGPSRRPGFNEMPGVNRLPDSHFVDMTMDDSQFATCRDIFADPRLTVSLESIPSEFAAQVPSRITNEQRRRLVAAVSGVKSWRYCHRVNKTPTGTVHATFSAPDRSVVLYSTSCDATSVYRQRLTSLDLGHRFFMVSAHELGHSIDAVLGRLPNTSDSAALAAAESRATWYGTFFAQCSSRLWQKILADNSDMDTTDRQRRGRARILRQWRSHETAIAHLRNELGTSSTALSSVSSTLAGVFACTTPR